MSTALISLGEALSLMPAAVRNHCKHKRSTSMPIFTAHPILADFKNQLEAKVEILMLQQHQQPDLYNLSAAWLGQALEVLLFIYSNIKDLYPHMQLDNTIEENWLSQHMDDLVNLLDVCNVLRESISEIKKHNISVQITLHGLRNGHAQIPCALSHDHMINIQLLKAKNSPRSCVEELKKNKDMEYKLAKCMSTLKRMANSLQSTRATAMDESGVEEAIDEAKAITIFACTALVTTFSFNRPCRSFMPGTGFLKEKSKISPTHLPLLNDINCKTNMMQHKIKEAIEMLKKRSSSSKILLEELNRVDLTHGNLNIVLHRYLTNKRSMLSTKLQDELKACTHAVHMSTTELENALTHIDHKINDLFRLLISSRVALLNSLTFF